MTSYGVNFLGEPFQPPGKQYAVYIIDLKRADDKRMKKWQVRRRYSEFVLLSSEVRSCRIWVGVNLVQLKQCWKNRPEGELALPPKRWFTSTSDPAVADAWLPVASRPVPAAFAVGRCGPRSRVLAGIAADLFHG